MRIVAAVTSFLVACASSDEPKEAPPDTAPSSCAWDVDDLLGEADLPVEDREQCGSFGGFEPEEVAVGYQCLQDASADDRAAELTVNYCVDCSIPSTFVATTDGDLLRVELENDMFGDHLRTATVERCAEIIIAANDLPECTEPVLLHRCQDRR